MDAEDASTPRRPAPAVTVVAPAPGRPYRPRLGALGLAADPVIRAEYRSGFDACARAVRRQELPRPFQVRAPTRRDAAFLLLAQARPTVQRAARAVYPRVEARYPRATLGNVVRVARKGCVDALELGAVHRVHKRLRELPKRVARAAKPRVVIYGNLKLRLDPAAVELIAQRSRDPRFIMIEEIAALPSKYRKNEFLQERTGVGETRGPIWIVRGSVRFSNECLDVAAGASCSASGSGRGHIVIEDSSGTISESASG